MSRRSVVLLAAGCFVAGLATGGLLSLAWQVSIAGPIVDGAADNLAAHLESEAYAKYRWGAYPAARKALLEHAQFATVLAENGEGIRVHLLSSAAGLSYARAAVAAQRAGISADSDRFFRLAQRVYARAGEQPTEKQLRELVVSADRDWDREAGGTGGTTE